MIAFKHFNKFAFAMLFLVLFSVLDSGAQAPTVRLPRPSQKASVMQTVGVTDITITYSRPAVKGRKIWGEPTAAELTDVKGAATLDNQNTRPKDAPIRPVPMMATFLNTLLTPLLKCCGPQRARLTATGSSTLRTAPGAAIARHR